MMAYVLYRFQVTAVYSSHFFDRGDLVTQYNQFRAVFVLLIFWLIYTAGVGSLSLVGAAGPVLQLRSLERIAICFFAGAGVWHVFLLVLGLLGLYQKGLMLAVVLVVMALSVPHLATCLRELASSLRAQFAWSQGWSLVGLRIVLPFVLVIVGGLFVLVKGLYPAGGHDYYTHYFYYYNSVVRHGSIFPNEVWYHFYYSKGAGLYFLAMLLTDPLAPQLVTTAFIGAGAITVALILRQSAASASLPWIGAILYIALLIYTPGPLENLKHGGWGDLEKLHEPAAVLLLGILWITTRIDAAVPTARRLWLFALVSGVVCLVIITTVMAAVVGGFLVLLMTWALWRKNRPLAMAALLGATAAGLSLMAILVLNYLLTGLPLDQGILLFWPIVDLEKIQTWGVLNELLVLHWALTGYLANKVPLTPEVAFLVFKYLRLEIWWPVLLMGVIGMVYAAQSRRLTAIVGAPDYQATMRSLLILVFAFTVLAVGMGIGRQQPISFYRFSSFMYAPTLCIALICWAALPGWRDLARPAVAISLAGTLVVAAFSAGAVAKWAFKEPITPIIIGHKNSFRNIVVNASHFYSGRFSIKDAYQNQQGWPGRMPWGGLYPAMEQVWKLVGPRTPVYSMHIHSYCMLPDCPVYGFMSTRVTPDMDVVLLGEPHEAIAALKRSGMNFFFFSEELQLYTPLVLSSAFSPRAIDRYLGVKWTDGTSYLLTWRDDATGPIDQQFLDSYAKRAAESPTAVSFPVDEWRKIFAHFRKKGLHPYRLPWCTTCDGMDTD
jgi:hypothetical protein